MGGYDHLEVVKRNVELILSDGGSAPHKNFVRTCNALGLPLAKGKSLVRGLLGPILGGEIDGQYHERVFRRTGNSSYPGNGGQL